MWDAFMTCANFLDKPITAIYNFLPWWCGIIFVVGALTIAIVDYNKYDDMGLGGDFLIWFSLLLLVVFIIWGLCRLLDPPREGAIMDASGTLFLFLFIWPLIKTIVLLFKNRKSSIWAIPFYLLCYFGFLLLMEYAASFVGGVLILGALVYVILYTVPL